MSNPIQPPGNYPAASWEPAQPAIKGPPPAPVVNAFRAILVSVALSLIGVVVTLTSQDSIRAKLHEASPTLTSATLDVTMTFVFVGLGLLFGLIGLAQPAAAITRGLGLVTLVLDVAIIVLLAQRRAAEYFKRP
jgi:hypothetical protein